MSTLSILACQHNLTSVTGTIIAPSPPVTCVWHIHFAAGKRIQVTFSKFNLSETGENCGTSSEHLDLYEKGQTANHLYCGHKLPPVFKSLTNHVIITYTNTNTKNISVSKGVFTAKYVEYVLTPSTTAAPTTIHHNMTTAIHPQTSEYKTFIIYSRQILVSTLHEVCVH